MSEKIKDGGPAFPLQSIGPHFPAGYSGMTLRDYFAAKAMQGFCTIEMYPSMENIARDAYALADAMLEARGNK